MTTIKITYTYEVDGTVEGETEPEKMQGEAKMMTEIRYLPPKDSEVYQTVFSGVIKHFFMTTEKKNGHVSLSDLRVWIIIHDVEVL